MNLVERAAEAESRLRVGARIRELRLARDLRQIDLATQIGCSDSHIANIERGHSPATDETRQLIARALGVQPEDLDEAVAS